jgi:hypothetical protein
VSWDDVVHPLAELGGFWVGVFTLYISFTYFAVLNVVTGIFCQSAIETAQNNEDLMVQAQIASKEMYVKRIKKLFNELDEDASGSLTIAELEEHLQDSNVQAVFASMDIGSSDAWTLFKMLASDEGCEVTSEEFVEGLMRLKGNAKRADFVELHVLIKRFDIGLHAVTGMIESLDHKVAQVSGKLIERDKSKQQPAKMMRKDLPFYTETTQSTTDEDRSFRENTEGLCTQDLWDSVLTGPLSSTTAVHLKKQSPRLHACNGDIGNVNPIHLDEDGDPRENAKRKVGNLTV